MGPIRIPARPKEHLALFPRISFDKSIDVAVTTLDPWCAGTRIKDVDVIRADVQGAEEDLILGGLQALRTTKYVHTAFSGREIYENAIGLQGIPDLLPDFAVVEVFDRDVLLVNRRPWG